MHFDDTVGVRHGPPGFWSLALSLEKLKMYWYRVFCVWGRSILTSPATPFHALLGQPCKLQATHLPSDSLSQLVAHGEGTFHM